MNVWFTATVRVIIFFAFFSWDPSADLSLAIHAACVKVAHLSGAAEHIENVLRRLEDTRVLAEDGGSSEVL